MTVLLMDERLPDAPLFSTQAGIKGVVNGRLNAVLSRYGYSVRTLLPICSLHAAEFGLESQAYAPEDYRQAAADTLNALRKTPRSGVHGMIFQ